MASKQTDNANLALWDRLARTDPNHTSKFTRAGGFKGTAIKPMWAIRRATQEFGPIGEGWGFEEDQHITMPCDDGQVLVYIRARVWFTDGGKPYWTGPQWGGDFVVKKNKHGLNPDDEAFKKALTDAVMKCLAYIGIGADIHMGQFDDQKYVAELAAEFEQVEYITDEQVAKIRQWITDTDTEEAAFCGWLKVDSIESIPADQYDRALTALKHKAEKMAATEETE
ncbi:MAG: hypothetical protein ABEH64_12990 [Salinirussus sp.]